MTTGEQLLQELINNIGHPPTNDQLTASKALVEFLYRDDSEECFVLSGYAGTGKTTLLAALVKTLQNHAREPILLAPTGRAAKVLARTAGTHASTIHRHIYQVRESEDELATFRLKKNQSRRQLYIVDEASMIGRGDRTASFSVFMQGLLGDLSSYVRSGYKCRLILSGDEAQLPPVGESVSPALSPEELALHFMRSTFATLREVVRQAQQSGILTLATLLRERIEAGLPQLPPLFNPHLGDVRVLSHGQMLESLYSSYREADSDETLVVTRSNVAANRHNRLIRTHILNHEEEVSSGDALMVCKNSYFWSQDIEEIPFIANGDIVRVERVHGEQQCGPFRFLRMDLSLENETTGKLEEITATALLNVLDSQGASLPYEEWKRLFVLRQEELSEGRRKRSLRTLRKKDELMNALEVKYAYAVTCHKAQGGQWRHVYVDLSFLSHAAVDIDTLRWLYTAFTRASEMLYLVNPPAHLVMPAP